MSRNKNSVSLLVLFLIAAAALWTSSGDVPSARGATGQICDQFASTTQGNYTIMNNRWGTSATQCINVTANGFQLVQQDGMGNLTGAPVSYPAIYVGCHYGNCSPNTNLPMRLRDIGSVMTSASVSFPSAGTYDASYDIWVNADANVSGVQDTEVMIWLNHTGSIRPIGASTGSISLAGRSWDVWVGNNGQNNVVSYVATGVTSFSTDVKPFLSDALTRGSGFGDSSWYLTSVQLGFEPWVSGVGLAVNSFATTVNAGTSGGGGGGGGGGGNTGSTCSPVTGTIAAPFAKDGAGTFCFKASSLGSFINSWNVTNLTVNGVAFNNVWAAASSLPAAIGGFWYVSYTGPVGWSHFEAK